MAQRSKQGIECTVVLLINNLNPGKSVTLLYTRNILMAYWSLCLGQFDRLHPAYVLPIKY